MDLLAVQGTLKSLLQHPSSKASYKMNQGAAVGVGPGEQCPQHQEAERERQAVGQDAYGGRRGRVHGLGSCSRRDSQESSPTPQFKSINSLALSLLHSPTLTLSRPCRKRRPSAREDGGVSGVSSSCGARGGFLPRHDEDLTWRAWQPTPVFLPGESQGWGHCQFSTGVSSSQF